MREMRAFLSNNGDVIVERFDFIPAGVGDVFAGSEHEVLRSMYATNFSGDTGAERYDYVISADASLRDSKEACRRGDVLALGKEPYHYQPGLERSLHLPIDEPSHANSTPGIEEHLLIDVYYRVDGAYLVVTQDPGSIYYIHIGEKNTPMTDVIRVQDIGPDMRDGSPIVLTTARGRLVPNEENARWGHPGRYTVLARLAPGDYRRSSANGHLVLKWM